MPGWRAEALFLQYSLSKYTPRASGGGGGGGGERIISKKICCSYTRMEVVSSSSTISTNAVTMLSFDGILEVFLCCL